MGSNPILHPTDIFTIFATNKIRMAVYGYISSYGTATNIAAGYPYVLLSAVRHIFHPVSL